jgi:uncharacterized membrane protein
MISREFLLWLESDWRRTLIMALIAATMAFMLMVSVLLSIHHSQLQEQQLQRLIDIEAEARAARAEAERNKIDVNRTKQEVMQLERAVKEGDQ